MYNPGEDPNYILVKNPDGTFSYKLKNQVTTKDKVVKQPAQIPSEATQPINPNTSAYQEDDYYTTNNKDVMNEVAPKGRTGRKINKNYSQSSIVKAFK